MEFVLQVDDRERGLFPALAATFADGEYEVKRLARSDFAVVSRQPADADAEPMEPMEPMEPAERLERLEAIVERKTLKDLAASLKDQRLENLDGMLEVREQCGCDVWLLIEGPAFPAPSTKYGRVPYSTLEALILDASIRDGIFVARARNDSDTTRWLQKLMSRYRRRQELRDQAGGGEMPRAAHARALVMVRKERKAATDAGLVADMWAKLPGVSPATGQMLLSVGSIADWVAKTPEEAAAALNEIRYPSGMRISRRARASVADVVNGDAAACAKLCGGAPRLTEQAAATFLSEFTIEQMLEAEMKRMTAFKPPGARQKMGKKAEKLVSLLRYSCVAAGAAADAAAAAAGEDEDEGDEDDDADE